MSDYRISERGDGKRFHVIRKGYALLGIPDRHVTWFPRRSREAAQRVIDRIEAREARRRWS